jgi:tetratricopeptide (TPR) repeat protein
MEAAHTEVLRSGEAKPLPWYERLTAAVWMRVILLLSGAVFLPAIGYDFVFDDQQQILLNPWLIGWAHIGQFFTHHLWAFSPDSSLTSGNFYRPVFLLWLLLLNHLTGSIPGFFHLATIGLHLIAVYLTYALALRVSGDRATALFAALIFGLHPVHIEAVVWISGGTEPLFAVFFLGSLLCYLRSRDEDANSLSWLAASWLCFALAMFAKETALVLPCVILVHRMASNRTIRHGRIQSTLKLLLPYILLTALYSVCRFRALGGWSGTRISLDRQAMLNLPLRAWWYPMQLVWPFKLSPYYRTPAGSDLPLPGLFALGALFVALLAFGFWRARRYPGWAMTMTLSILALAPVLTTDFIGLHDRYLYLPSFGFSVALAAVICRLRMKSSNATRLLRACLAVAIIVVLGSSVISQERFWDTDISLFTRAVDVNPEPRTISRLAAVYGEQEGDPGVQILLDGVARFPHSVLLQQDAGIYYYSVHKPDEAASHLRSAIAEAGSSPMRGASLCYLGMIDYSKGNLVSAEAELREAVRIAPSQVMCQRTLDTLVH